MTCVVQAAEGNNNSCESVYIRPDGILKSLIKKPQIPLREEKKRLKEPLLSISDLCVILETNTGFINNATSSGWGK